MSARANVTPNAFNWMLPRSIQVEKSPAAQSCSSASVAFRPPKFFRDIVVVKYTLAMVELLRAGADQSAVSALADPKLCGILSQDWFEHCDRLGRPHPFVLFRHSRESTPFDKADLNIAERTRQPLIELGLVLSNYASLLVGKTTLRNHFKERAADSQDEV